MFKDQEILVNQEISGMMKKGEIRESQPHPNQFVSTLFSVGKDGNNRPVINFKKLNKLIPYQHFKMEGLHSLREMLQQGHYMCKLDMMPTFRFPYTEIAGIASSFFFNGQGSSTNSCFGLRPAPRTFTKILKVPICLIRRLIIRIVIYLDEMLLLGRSIKEVLIATDTVIFLLQHLGFVINLKKSILTTPQQKSFLVY